MFCGLILTISFLFLLCCFFRRKNIKRFDLVTNEMMKRKRGRIATQTSRSSENNIRLWLCRACVYMCACDVIRCVKPALHVHKSKANNRNEIWYLRREPVWYTPILFPSDRRTSAGLFVCLSGYRFGSFQFVLLLFIYVEFVISSCACVCLSLYRSPTDCNIINTCLIFSCLPLFPVFLTN